MRTKRVNLKKGENYSDKASRQKNLGEYLKNLREEKGYSIQRVSKETGISDPFLYQLEKGEKSLTSADFFNKLANYYKIKVHELLKRAGYLPEDNLDETLDKAIDVVTKDKTYKIGPAFWSKLTFPEKIEVLTMYERATGKKILDKGLELFQ